MKQREINSTDKCYLTYSDELNGGGYLICAYNHKVGEKCLMDEKYKSENSGLLNI